jgi:hypothetical protein
VRSHLFKAVAIIFLLFSSNIQSLNICQIFKRAVFSEKKEEIKMKEMGNLG